MKPLFSIDITTDKKNEKINGDEFIRRGLTDEMSQALESSQLAAENISKKGRLPVWMEMVKILTGAFGLMVVVTLATTALSIGLGKAFSNAPVISTLGIISVAVWAMLFVLSKIRSAAQVNDSDAEAAIRALNEAIRSAHDMLGVPDDAENVDILMFRYKLKKGEPVPVDTLMQPITFINLELKIFVKDGCLCLSDLSNVYCFALDELKRITRINKRIQFPYWNKEIAHNELMYKPYKITHRDGIFSVKPYYVLTVEHDGETYGIYLPPYELPVFERLAEISADK